MKNISLILNFVLLIAVGFLYAKVYSNETPQPQKVQPEGGMPVNGIVFINSDTLLQHYNFFKELKDAFIDKQDSIDKMLEARGRSLERDVNTYQEKAGGMTPEQRMHTEEQLMQRQESLVNLRRSLLESLSNEEDHINDTLHNSLRDYLLEYNKEKKYYFILGYQRGTGILLANDSLDVTAEVLEGLNKLHESKK